MSVELVVHGRPRSLEIPLARVLPAATRRMVGPFIFLDHMGPAEVPPGQGLSVRPHPHVGLATVTWLFEGAIFHRDSLGNQQLIRPGELNWMTAGRGIVHSERSPADGAGGTLHGLQMWVALPAEHEDTAPTFAHYPTLPTVDRPGARLHIIAGTAYGATAPTEALSPLFYVEARLQPGAQLPVVEGYTERALYVVDGDVVVDGTTYPRETMVIFAPGEPAVVESVGPALVMLLGGEPVGRRFIDWNFVATSPERIEAAKAAWRAFGTPEGARFPVVPGDEGEFIPLP
jgi:redox-sensitive bicupin YhaK (pirin superfamily)